MRFVRECLQNTLVGGVLVVLPIYLALLVLLKGMQSLAPVVRPFTLLLPAEAIRRASARVYALQWVKSERP